MPHFPTFAICLNFLAFAHLAEFSQNSRNFTKFTIFADICLNMSHLCEFNMSHAQIYQHLLTYLPKFAKSFHMQKCSHICQILPKIINSCPHSVMLSHIYHMVEFAHLPKNSPHAQKKLLIFGQTFPNFPKFPNWKYLN
jgi:hypothetical protein